MRAFLSGINNFWVGLVFGLSLPLLLIVLTLSVTLYQLTDFANDVAITPLYQRGEQTLARVDQLLMTLDQRLSDDDPGLLAPLKQIELLPELKLLALSIAKLQVEENQPALSAVKAELATQLDASLKQRFATAEAEALSQHLQQILEILAKGKEAPLPPQS
ncbi:hypothetical protein [Shewanella algae]|uniref:hypothetical protein n=1 Tax=Shewanella algae TaxID=38313 RepID=UPI0031F48147